MDHTAIEKFQFWQSDQTQLEMLSRSSRSMFYIIDQSAWSRLRSWNKWTNSMHDEKYIWQYCDVKMTQRLARDVIEIENISCWKLAWKSFLHFLDILLSSFFSQTCMIIIWENFDTWCFNHFFKHINRWSLKYFCIILSWCCKHVFSQYRCEIIVS